MSSESLQEDLGSADRVQRDGSLVLTRLVGESLLFDGQVKEVKVIKISGKRATLRVVAPTSTRVVRS